MQALASPVFLFEQCSCLCSQHSLARSPHSAQHGTFTLSYDGEFVPYPCKSTGIRLTEWLQKKMGPDGKYDSTVWSVGMNELGEFVCGVDCEDDLQSSIIDRGRYLSSKRESITTSVCG